MDPHHQEILGKGSYGTVSSSSIQNFVVKTTFNFTEQASTLKEIIVAATFSHPNLLCIKPSNILSKQKQCQLILPKYPFDLHRYTRSVTLSQRIHVLRYDVLPSLLQATFHLYRHGLIHMDIKPSNILYDPQTHHVLLIDFGLATSRSTPYSNHGTPEFSPPHSYVTTFSLPNDFDIWSIGCVILDTLFAHHNQSWFSQMKNATFQQGVFTKLQQCCESTSEFSILLHTLKIIFNPTVTPTFAELFDLYQLPFPFTSSFHPTQEYPISIPITPSRSAFIQHFYHHALCTHSHANTKSIFIFGIYLYDSLSQQNSKLIVSPLLLDGLYYITYSMFCLWSDPLFKPSSLEIRNVVKQVLHTLNYQCYIPTVIDYLIHQFGYKYNNIDLQILCDLLQQSSYYTQLSLCHAYLQRCF